MKKTKKDYTLELLFICLLLAILGSHVSCTNKLKASGNGHTYESSDITYYNGEILLPDYVHTDTLVVIDAELLNDIITQPDIASDQDISECLTGTTVPIDRYRDYQNKTGFRSYYMPEMYGYKTDFISYYFSFLPTWIREELAMILHNYLHTHCKN